MYVSYLKQQLLSLGFIHDVDDYEFDLSAEIYLKLTCRFEQAKLHAFSNGVPVHLGYIDVQKPFNLKNFLKTAEKTILTYYKNEGEITHVINAINDWIKAYQTGYTFDNFAKACMKNIQVSYAFYLGEDDYVLLQNKLTDKLVTVIYDKKQFIRVTPEEMSMFRKPYDVLHKYGENNPKIKIRIRKSTIDELLESL